MSGTQPELIPFGNLDAIELPPRPDLTGANTLVQALEPFRDYMLTKEFAINTIKSFLNDMQILIAYLGEGATLAGCSPARLEAFVEYLQNGRGVACSPKSLYRRITTLKVFFGWLADKAVLATNPAAGLALERPASPLPAVLDDAQVAKLLETTAALCTAPAPDARPHLLLTLLLDTGIKKAECMGIGLQHIDLTDVEHPSVYIHYEKARQNWKSRRLALSPGFPKTLETYLRRYQPKALLFECTPRNLEYVLRAASLLAGLPVTLSFETLRWTSALRCYKAGMEPDRLRRRLGLSLIAWRETAPVLERLAQKPL
jgi:integrase/recombinase XerD